MRGQTALSYEGAGSRMSRLGVNAVLGDERTLADLLRSFDQVTADQVRAEAERPFQPRPDTRTLRGPGAGSRYRVVALSVVKLSCQCVSADLHSDGWPARFASFVARVRARQLSSQPSRELLQSAKRANVIVRVAIAC